MIGVETSGPSEGKIKCDVRTEKVAIPTGVTGSESGSESESDTSGKLCEYKLWKHDEIMFGECVKQKSRSNCTQVNFGDGSNCYWNEADKCKPKFVPCESGDPRSITGNQIIDALKYHAVPDLCLSDINGDYTDAFAMDFVIRYYVAATGICSLFFTLILLILFAWSSSGGTKPSVAPTPVIPIAIDENGNV